MDLDVLLAEAEPEVVDEAYATLERSHAAHYEAAGEAYTRQRLGDLFRLTVEAISTRDLAEMGAYAGGVAAVRFTQGFDIGEVQAAFNALEQAMWRRVVADQAPAELAQSVGMLGTVLGFGKDSLARKYVSMASKRHVPSLDYSALFAGANS